MKKKEEYIGKVDKIKFPNRAIVSVEGEEKKVAVKNALPGETIRFRVTKNRDQIAAGNFIECIEKSPLSTQEECPHFRKCGGCLYQGFSYETQLSIKENQIKELFEKYIPTDMWENIVSSPKTKGYRNKMEFSFGDLYKGGPLSLGMHKRNAHYDIVTVSGCAIMSDDFTKILEKTLEFFSENKTPFFHSNTHEGYLRHLLLREGKKTGEILIDLVTSTQMSNLQVKEDELLARWKDEILSLGLENKIVGILHTKNDSLADVVKDDGTDILYGQDYFFEKLFDLTFKITPFSFFQTNTYGAEKLYEKVREYVGDIKGKVIYDLYSGTGTITQLMAQVASKAIGVEIVEEAVEAAKINTKLNGLDNCEYIAGDVLKVLESLDEKNDEVVEESKLSENKAKSNKNELYEKIKEFDAPDLIILDPPREGIHPKALPRIIDFGVNEIVYVSCKPTSLVRDLELLTESGYTVKKACMVDMFPWTGNVEVVTLLAKSN